MQSIKIAFAIQRTKWLKKTKCFQNYLPSAELNKAVSFNIKYVSCIQNYTNQKFLKVASAFDESLREIAQFYRELLSNSFTTFEVSSSYISVTIFDSSIIIKFIQDTYNTLSYKCNTRTKFLKLTCH